MDEYRTPYDYLVRWERPNEQVLDFLADAPLIFRNHGHLAGTSAIRLNDVAHADQASMRHRSLWMAGPQRLFVAMPTGYGSQEVGALSGQEKGGIPHVGGMEFCNFERILPMLGVNQLTSSQSHWN